MSNSFATIDPSVKTPLTYLTAEKIRRFSEVDESLALWRVNAHEEPGVTIVITYTGQPFSATPSTPSADNPPSHNEDDDNDGPDQLQVRSARSYFLNKSPSKPSKTGECKSRTGSYSASVNNV
jgi:hypothetical protein